MSLTESSSVQNLLQNNLKGAVNTDYTVLWAVQRGLPLARGSRVLCINGVPVDSVWDLSGSMHINSHCTWLCSLRERAALQDSL